ncbi:uncharacterized protein MELLADRAFT_90981 [Melampsora larici-populina 98AG31]|uniref:Virilizer N-terminal domain-containing protein n=1 Tax=Melampsora larici-populina (strain 98AG31 / pathotype 3-4-7) TaxID=747676 RepID=F4R892_MELLP|nr:uncharacterized protein MELLADRAFT_90981 [Melampsora larici-populina 98AG31]EGG11452.1 hypothetical protein MELLADRAFT_90981 [Melampsora larici-populina 98AG31]
MVHIHSTHQDLVFYGTLNGTSAYSLNDKQKRNGEASTDLNETVVKFKQPTQLATFQVIPNRTRVFPQIDNDQRYGETSPNVFSLQLTVHYVGTSSSSKNSRSFDVDVDLEEGAEAPKWNLEMDQGMLAHMITFQGKFDSITLAIHGQTPESSSSNGIHEGKSPTNQSTLLDREKKERDPTLDSSLLLAKEFLSITSTLKQKASTSHLDLVTSLQSCVQSLYLPSPTASRISSQQLLSVGQAQDGTKFAKDLAQLARSCFDQENHSISSNSDAIRRFLEGLVALSDLIISRDNFSSDMTYSLDIVAQLVKISPTAIHIVSASNVIQYAITILKSSTSDSNLTPARDAAVNMLTICSEEATLLSSHVMGKFALADSFKWLSGQDHLLIRFKAYLTILEISKFIKRLNHGSNQAGAGLDDDLDGIAIDNAEDRTNGARPSSTLSEFELMKLIHLFQRLIGYMCQSSFVPFSMAPQDVSSPDQPSISTPPLHSTSTTYKALLKYLEAEDFLGSLLTLLRIQFKSPPQLAWEQKGKSMLVECVVQFFTNLFTNSEIGLPHLVPYFVKNSEALSQWIATLNEFIPARLNASEESEQRKTHTMMMLLSTRNWQSISNHQSDFGPRPCLLAIARLITGYTSLGALLSVVLSTTSEEGEGLTSADVSSESHSKADIKLAMKKLEGLSVIMLSKRLLCRLVSCEQLSARIIQLNHSILRKPIPLDEPRHIFDWYSAVVLSDADIILSPNAKMVGQALMNHLSTSAKPMAPGNKLQLRANILMSIEDPVTLLPNPATVRFADLWEVEVRMNVLGALSNLRPSVNDTSNIFGKLLCDQFNDVRRLATNSDQPDSSFCDVILELVEITWKRLESLKKRHQLFNLTRLSIFSTLFEAVRRLCYIEFMLLKNKPPIQFIRVLSEKAMLINMILADSIQMDRLLHPIQCPDFAVDWVYEKRFRTNLISLLRSLTWSSTPDESSLTLGYMNQFPNETHSNPRLEIEQSNLAMVLNSVIKVSVKLSEYSPIVLDFLTRCLPLLPDLGKAPLTETDKNALKRQVVKKSAIDFKNLVNELAIYFLEHPHLILGSDLFFGTEPLKDGRTNQIKIWLFSKLIYTFDLIHVSSGSFPKFLIKKTLAIIQSIIESTSPQSTDSDPKPADEDQSKYITPVTLLYSCWLICSDYFKQLPPNSFGNSCINLWRALKFGLEYPDEANLLLSRKKQTSTNSEATWFAKYLQSTRDDYHPSPLATDVLSDEITSMFMKKEIELVSVLIKCVLTCQKYQKDEAQNRLDRHVFDGGSEHGIINLCYQTGYNTGEDDLVDIDFLSTLSNAQLAKTINVTSLNLLTLPPTPIYQQFPAHSAEKGQVPTSLKQIPESTLVSSSITTLPLPTQPIEIPSNGHKTEVRMKPISKVPDLYPPMPSSAKTYQSDETRTRHHHHHHRASSPSRRSKPTSYSSSRPQRYEHYEPKSKTDEENDGYHTRKVRDSDYRRNDTRDSQIRESDRSRGLDRDREEKEYTSSNGRRRRNDRRSESEEENENKEILKMKRKEEEMYDHDEIELEHERKYKTSRKYEEDEEQEEEEEEDEDVDDRHRFRSRSKNGYDRRGNGELEERNGRSYGR